MNTNSYIFSKHSVERFIERFGHLVGSEREVMPYLRNAIVRSIEEKSFLNNTQFMTNAYEKYGYKRYKCRRYNNIVFLIVDNVIVTILDTTMFPLQINQNKFKRTRKQIELDNLLGWRQ